MAAVRLEWTGPMSRCEGFLHEVAGELITRSQSCGTYVDTPNARIGGALKTTRRWRSSSAGGA
jgi:hypothetical protein